VRFYGWHIYGLTLIVIIFGAWHIFRVRRDGGISSKQQAGPKEKISRVTLNEKENIAMFIVSILLIVLALVFPPGLDGPADFNNIPEDAVAPWFFMWVQKLLEYGDALLLGVGVPLVSLLLLAGLPYLLDRSKTGVGRWFNREGRIAQLVILVIIIGMITLTILKWIN
jgi:quinol-cytochrome oxidoreductase complex cytochrome b subunit